MTVSHLAQLRELQEENTKLKRMYADLVNRPGIRGGCLV